MKTTPGTEAPAINRRGFLKSSTALTGAALAGTLELSRQVHAAGSDVIKVGLIGCGGRGTEAAINAMNAGPDVRLTAMAELFRDRLEASRQRLRAAKPGQVAVDDDHCFVGLEAYRQVLASGVDAVLITPSSCFIPRIFHAAVEARKHIFCEKPHGLDVPGVNLVAAAAETARRHGLSVVSGLCWRYDLGVRETMKRVHDGQIGDIVAIQETYVGTPYIVRERQEGWSEMEYQLRNWYHFNYLSGDQTSQQLIHSMDKASWAMRDQPPVKVWGTGGRQVCTHPKFGDQYDHFSAIYEYANGVRVFGYCRDMPDCWNNTSDLILGTKGRCNLLSFTIDGEKKWRYEGPRPNMYDVEHAELFASIRKREPLNNASYMCLSSLLAIAAQVAAYSGQLVPWDELLQSKRQLLPAALSFTSEPPVKPGPGGIYPTPMPGKEEYERWMG